MDNAIVQGKKTHYPISSLTSISIGPALLAKRHRFQGPRMGIEDAPEDSRLSLCFPLCVEMAIMGETVPVCAVAGACLAWPGLGKGLEAC